MEEKYISKLLEVELKLKKIEQGDIILEYLGSYPKRDYDNMILCSYIQELFEKYKKLYDAYLDIFDRKQSKLEIMNKEVKEMNDLISANFSLFNNNNLKLNEKYFCDFFFSNGLDKKDKNLEQGLLFILKNNLSRSYIQFLEPKILANVPEQMINEVVSKEVLHYAFSDQAFGAYVSMAYEIKQREDQRLLEERLAKEALLQFKTDYKNNLDEIENHKVTLNEIDLNHPQMELVEKLSVEDKFKFKIYQINRDLIRRDNFIDCLIEEETFFKIKDAIEFYQAQLDELIKNPENKELESIIENEEVCNQIDKYKEIYQHYQDNIENINRDYSKINNYFNGAKGIDFAKKFRDLAGRILKGERHFKVIEYYVLNGKIVDLGNWIRSLKELVEGATKESIFMVNYEQYVESVREDYQYKSLAFIRNENLDKDALDSCFVNCTTNNDYKEAFIKTLDNVLKGTLQLYAFDGPISPTMKDIGLIAEYLLDYIKQVETDKEYCFFFDVDDLRVELNNRTEPETQSIEILTKFYHECLLVADNRHELTPEQIQKAIRLEGHQKGLEMLYRLNEIHAGRSLMFKIKNAKNYKLEQTVIEEIRDVLAKYFANVDQKFALENLDKDLKNVVRLSDYNDRIYRTLLKISDIKQFDHIETTEKIEKIKSQAVIMNDI